MSIDQQTELDRSTGSGTFLERLANRVGINSKVSTVFGDPVERDGITVIPVETFELMPTLFARRSRKVPLPDERSSSVCWSMLIFDFLLLDKIFSLRYQFVRVQLFC